MTRTGGPRVVLFTRAELPTPARKRRDAVVQELRCLAEGDALDGFEVVDWAKRVPINAPSAERERYAEFSAWAGEAGVALPPFFDTRLCYCMETGEKREELVLPAMCLAIYEDGDLRTVAPHADGRRTVSVEDAIDRLGVAGASDDADVATVPTQ
jgi:hypothetical protein